MLDEVVDFCKFIYFELESKETDSKTRLSTSNRSSLDFDVIHGHHGFPTIKFNQSNFNVRGHSDSNHYYAPPSIVDLSEDTNSILTPTLNIRPNVDFMESVAQQKYTD